MTPDAAATDAVAPRPSPHRFTVAEYEAMGAAGILAEDDRVELIEGEVVDLSPIGPAHAAVVNRLTQLLVLALRGRAIVTVQNPAWMGSRSQPQPDLVVARLRDDFYGGSHPAPGDVLLLVEVSDSSLAYDRDVKAPLYARAGVPELWIVDVGGRRVEVCREPAADGYRSVSVLRPGEAVALLAFPDVMAEVAAVLDAS